MGLEYLPTWKPYKSAIHVVGINIPVPRMVSGQNIIFHQPRFPWNFQRLPLLFTTIWGENSCEVVIIWPDGTRWAPIAVINGNITPINGLINSYNPSCRSYFNPVISGRWPTLYESWIFPNCPPASQKQRCNLDPNGQRLPSPASPEDDTEDEGTKIPALNKNVWIASNFETPKPM